MSKDIIDGEDHAEEPSLAPVEDDDPELTEFVLSMTKAMNRTGYYSRTHPEGISALAGLFDSFLTLMSDRGNEFSFQLTHSREVNLDNDVSLYDGLHDIKMMRDILQQGAANTFVPKMAAYFQRQGLLSFTIRKDVSPEHFNIFIERMTHPASAQEKRPGEKLSLDLAAAGVRGVSVVFDEDRISGLRGSIPWRAELALARLRKDLRMIPILAHATEEEIHQIKSRLMDDILRGLQQVGLLIALARYLGDALVGQEKVMSRDEAEQHLIAGVNLAILAPVAQEMVLPWVENDGDDESDENRTCRERLIAHLIRRLLARKERAATHALVVLYDSQYIDIDSLPHHAKELIRGNALAESAQKSPESFYQEVLKTGSRDEYSSVLDDLRIACAALMELGEWGKSEAILRTIWKCAKGEICTPAGGAEKAHRAMLEIGFDGSDNLIAAGITAEPQIASCVAIMRLLEPEAAAKVLLKVLATAKLVNTRKWALEELVKRAWDAPQLLLHTMSEKGTPWFVTRNVLTVIRKVKNPDAYTTVAQLYEHPKTQVRCEALITMAELSPERSMRIVEFALSDADPDIRRTASLAVATSEKPTLDAINRLLRMVFSEREKEGVRLQATASLGAIAQLHSVPHREEIIDGLRTVISDKYGTTLHRLKRLATARMPPPPGVLATACKALGVVGSAEDKSLLASCLQDTDRDVREAATHALGRLNALS